MGSMSDVKGSQGRAVAWLCSEAQWIMDKNTRCQWGQYWQYVVHTMYCFQSVDYCTGFESVQSALYMYNI